MATTLNILLYGAELWADLAKLYRSAALRVASACGTISDLPIDLLAEKKKETEYLKQ